MASKLMASYVLIMLIIAQIVTGSKCLDTRDAEVEQLLKKLNKPALKSIESPDGDIIDCVDINKQPAFDHPLLKNHTIKMRPSFYPEGWNNMSSSIAKQSSLVTQLWTINGKCPENTIPIRRTRKEDILRAKSIKRFGKKDPNSIYQEEGNGTHSYAIVYADGRFHGTKANINVWRPYLQKREEFSLSQIWLIGGFRANDTNTIEVGWQTYPDIYGDFNPRFFIYWTSDNYNTGCYNLLCEGFVQISRQIVPGAVINPTSIYNGEQQHLPVNIMKDRASGHWLLEVNNQRVGYWPRSLFTHLADAADHIQWGGEIIDEKTGGRHTTTQMGSGRFAEEGFRKASYFKNIEIVDENNIGREPTELKKLVDEEKCYNIIFQRDRLWGSYFFYGGPGRNRNCP